MFFLSSAAREIKARSTRAPTAHERPEATGRGRRMLLNGRTLWYLPRNFTVAIRSSHSSSCQTQTPLPCGKQPVATRHRGEGAQRAGLGVRLLTELHVLGEQISAFMARPCGSRCWTGTGALCKTSWLVGETRTRLPDIILIKYHAHKHFALLLRLSHSCAAFNFRGHVHQCHCKKAWRTRDVA